MGEISRLSLSQMPEQPSAPRMIAYVGAREMAELLSVSESTIWDWARKGYIPKPRKLASGSTRWKWVEVEQSIENASGSPAEDDPIMRASRGS
nr:helix-turn-helix domain-containing protein [uncultured Celeribacter sp.]